MLDGLRNEPVAVLSAIGWCIYFPIVMMHSKHPKIAVIGAGIAGLSLASMLSAYAEVTVFEKSAKPGGRAATHVAGEYSFDHGAQFFTVKSKAFKQFVNGLEAHGVVARWDARFAEIRNARITAGRHWDDAYPHYVGIPGMHAIGEYLAKDLDVRLHHAIQSIQRAHNKWILNSAHASVGEYDWVVFAMPAAQARDLLPDTCKFKTELSDVSMQACYALMLAYAEPKPTLWDAALISESVLSWASVNSSKPGRSSVFSMVTMSRNAWAEAHFNDHDEAVTLTMLTELGKVMDQDMNDFSYVKLKRWKYANAARRPAQMLFLDDDLQLASCGDWCKVGRIESAFTAASDLATHIQLRIAG